MTRKYQATIPAPVRELLGLKSGDRVVFKIEGDKVVLGKAQPIDLEFAMALEGTLSEWGSARTRPHTVIFDSFGIVIRCMKR